METRKSSGNKATGANTTQAVDAQAFIDIVGEMINHNLTLSEKTSG
nr:IncF plasmid conjugative transfer pilus assembly protein TraC [Escherichia coli]